jgi:hypothetical protein
MRLLGLGFVAFVMSANLAFALLAMRFGYDDILREPASVVLERFSAGGPELIGIWALFALSALAFAPLAVALNKALSGAWGVSMPIATMAGVVSAVLQAVGLSRWVFVVPGLAETQKTDPAFAANMFSLLNQYGGVAIGEHLGQLFLVLWTCGVAVTCWRGPNRLLRWAAILGFATIPGWIMGQTELFATVVPNLRVFEFTPYAFMAWEAWVLIMGIILIVAPNARRSAV